MENEKNNQEFVHKTSGEPLEDTQAEKAVGGQMECADSDYHGACCPKGVTQETFSRQNRNCYNRDAIYKCDF